MPVVNVKVDRLLALTVQVVALTVGDDGIYPHCTLVGHAEIEGGDVRWYGDTYVVGIDMGQYRLLLSILGSSRTGC